MVGKREEQTTGVLSKELFERDQEAYSAAALELVMQGGAGQLPPIPQPAKDEGIGLITHLPDKKIVSKYGDSLVEAFGVSFRFATAEEWEGLDRTKSRALIDEGLELVRQQHVETGVEPLVPTEPLQRVHFTTLGLIGEHPAYVGLREYVFSQPAYARLETLDELHLWMGVHAGGVKGRHEDRFMRLQVLAWNTGRSLGILDVLGELPK
jgi:hypothetical protein